MKINKDLGSYKNHLIKNLLQKYQYYYSRSINVSPFDYELIYFNDFRYVIHKHDYKFLITLIKLVIGDDN